MRKRRGITLAALVAVVLGVLLPVGAGGATRQTPQAAAGRYTNPIKGLGTKCSSDDPYLTEGPNHRFDLYFARAHSCADTESSKAPAPACESAKQAGRTFDDTYWVYRSSDPTKWTRFKPVPAMTICKVRHNDPFATSLWGAGALYVNKTQTYYLFYSVRERRLDSKTRTHFRTISIGVATSKHAVGPFTNHGIIVRGTAKSWYYGVHPFVDPASRRIYLYFTNHWKRNVVRRFNPKTNRAPGPNVVVLDSGLPLGTDTGCDRSTAATRRAGHQTWEHCVVEHPEVFYAPAAKPSHRYFMVYNGAGGGTRRYAIGYAYASSPTGRFTRSTAGDNPILHEQSVNGTHIYGPGAPNTFVDGANARWLFYRYYPQVPRRQFVPRNMAVNRLVRTGGRLSIRPTIGISQPKPSW